MEFEKSRRVVVEDSSSSSSPDSRLSASSTYRRAYRRRDHWAFGRRHVNGPSVVDLTKIRRPQNAEPEHPSVEPAIIWNAKIYRSLRDHYRDDPDFHNPDLTYVDDRPIELPVGVRPTQPPVDAKKTVPEPVEWAGPVITIETFVEANIQKCRSSGIAESLRLELLNPKCVSRRHLVVGSPFLADGLSNIVQYYPSFHRILSKEPRGELRFQEPFAVLFHHFDSIEVMADGTTAATICKNEHDGNTQRIDLTKGHMQHLIEFLRPIYQERILSYRKNISDSVSRVAFDMIWYLLRPGTDVYVQVEGSTHAAVVMDVKSNGFNQSDVWGIGNEDWWHVDLWRLETDGSRLRRGLISAQVTAYSGLREVTSLPVCPVSIWDIRDGGERRRQILRRSATFFKALHQGNLLADYNGPIKETNQYYAGKVVIDYRRGLADPDHHRPFPSRVKDYSDRFQEYDDIFINNDRSFHTTEDTRQRPTEPGSNDAVISWQGTQKWSNFNDYQDPEAPDVEPSGPVVRELTEHQLLLLCPDALAYALRYKQWILISLDYIQESVPSDESISNLVIGQDELKTIQALSNRQNSKIRHWSADFIEGKGSGQIILLHGPPGVGKTYTVEAISEWLHRPLLALTVADIGTIETLVEGQLMKWFDLAEAWNAVLLVDEADIFLERRQNRDLARNGLVSAFLRRMEYFKGLLFLTTNRVGQIDDAFISRVHVAIEYQPLNEETRRKVWNGFFRKLVSDRAGRIQIAPDAKKWILDTTSETQLNGRDIRNALQTAITLAEFESEEDPEYNASLATIVTKTHFQKVLDMSNRFRNYVTSIRREDEEKRAQGRGDRNDYGRGIANEMDCF